MPAHKLVYTAARPATLGIGARETLALRAAARPTSAVVAIAINTDSLRRKHRALDHILSPNYRRSKDHPSASFAVVDEKTITFLRRYIEMVHVLPAVDLPACASQIIGNLIYASTGVIKR